MDRERSFSWAQVTPLPLAEALAELRALKNGCTASQLQLRRQAFKKAERFMRRKPIEVGVAPLRLTFKNRNLPSARKDARVDIDVFAGQAFV
jgi:hypothetical protein